MNDAGDFSGGSLPGIRVIDLTQGIAGPYATKLLAGLGADVIKVEPPRGDLARTWSPICRGPDGQPHSALFRYLNTNKRSIALDLKSRDGHRAFLALVRHADLVFESFRPGTMDRLGLSFDRLRQVRSDTTLVSISNFGQKGPLRDFEATELAIFALGGRMAAAGTRPRPPVRLVGGSSLFTAGTVAAGAALIALRGRKNDGRGDHLDISIANVILGEPDRGVCLYSYSGIDMERPDGPRPFQSFPAADGFVVINVNRGIERVAQMIGRPELAIDPRFASNALRLEHADKLEPAIIEWTVTRTKAEILASAAEYRVIAAPVATIPEVLEEPTFRERRFIVRETAATCRCQSLVVGPPFRNHAAVNFGWLPDRPAPEFGEHSVEILTTVAAVDKPEAMRIAQAQTTG